MQAIMLVLYLCLAGEVPSEETCVHAPTRGADDVNLSVPYFGNYKEEAIERCREVAFQVGSAMQAELDKHNILLTITDNSLTCAVVLRGA